MSLLGGLHPIESGIPPAMQSMGAGFRPVTEVSDSAEYIVDDYSPLIAVGMRKLSSTYSGSCMRIREANLNAETDIGFDGNGDLDTAAIDSHCGVHNGYVVKWYDQSGNSNDLIATADVNEPQIYNGSVLLQSSIPSIWFSGTNMQLQVSGTASFRTVIAVCRPYALTADKIYSAVSGNTRGWAYNNAWKYSGSAIIYGHQQSTSVLEICNDAWNGASSSFKVNKSDEVTGNPGTFSNTGFCIGRYNNSSERFYGYISEACVWSTVESSADRDSVCDNMNDYFSIY